MSAPIQLLWNAYVGQKIRVTMRDERTKRGVQTTVAKAPFTDLGDDELEYYKTARLGYEHRFRYVETTILDVHYSDKGLLITTNEPLDPSEPEYKYSFWIGLNTEIKTI